MLAAPTAAVLLIGNELLTGKTRDLNGHLLAQVMRRRGVRLLEICTVADDPDDIGDALLRLLARTPLLFTSGGVGPTHDDITMSAIGRALARPLHRDPRMEKLLRAHFGAAITPEALKMAEVPVGTQLRAERGWPVLRLDVPAADPPPARAHDARIYILPGIPELCRSKVEALEAIPGELPDAGGWALEVLHTSRDESELAESLNRVVAAYPDVEIGSYPRYSVGPGGRLLGVVRITFEARGEAAPRAKEAHDALALDLGPGALTDPPT